MEAHIRTAWSADLTLNQRISVQTVGATALQLQRLSPFSARRTHQKGLIGDPENHPIAACFELGMLPTLKFATREIYSLLLRKHLIPRFGGHRVCDISRVEVQQYLLEKLKQGFAWEITNHLRHL